MIKRKSDTIIIIIMALVVGLLSYFLLFAKNSEISSIVLSKHIINIPLGNNKKLDITVLPENAQESNIIWESSNPNIASVTQSGIVIGNSIGETTITVKTTDGKVSDKCIVNVLSMEAEQIELDRNDIEVRINESKELNVIITPKELKEYVSWESNNHNIATVDNGKITGIYKGKTEIRAVYGYKEAICDVKVIIPVDKIEMEKKSISISVDKKEELKVIISPEEAQDQELKWESSDDDIAIVKDGVVEGIKPGNATIKASIDGKTVICKVTVTSKEKYQIKYVDSDKTITKEEGELLGNMPTPSKSGYKFIGWYTSKEKGDKVSEETIVTGNMTLYAHWEISPYSPLPQNLQQNFQLVTSYDSPTLKYWIEHSTKANKTHYSSNIYLTHIWMKDPANQIKVALGGGNSLGNKQPVNLITSEINSRGYQNKGLVAINSSFFGDSNVGSWGQTQSTYVIIHDGKILRDDTTKDLGKNVIVYSAYGITRDGDIKFYNMKLGKQVESKNEMIADGVKYSGVAWGVIGKDYAKKAIPTNGKPASRTLVCTVNRNNIIILTGYNWYFEQAARVAYNKLGCTTMINLDGGGSTTLLYKKNTSSIEKTFCTSRYIADMMYFVE